MMHSLRQKNRFVLDGFGCKQNLDCVQPIYDFLALLSEEADMYILVPPSVVRVPVRPADLQIETLLDWGISGTVIWPEGEAHVHTWPEATFVMLDILSGKLPDYERIENIFTITFNPDRVKRLESFTTGETTYDETCVH